MQRDETLMQSILSRAGTIAVLVSVLAGPMPVQAAEVPLGLDEAVEIAIAAEEPSLLRFDASAGAFEERAIADSELPDPMVRGTLLNFPTDTFSDNQEPMTQYQLGLRQEFPAGDTLAVRGERRRAEAEIERARKELVRRQILFDVRTGWFDLFYLENARATVGKSRAALEDLARALRSSFASGGMNGRDVLRVQLEQALIDDRLAALAQDEEKARARLARYLGAAANRPVPEGLPPLLLPTAAAQPDRALTSHPAVKVDDAVLATKQAEIELAEEAYKPSWALDAGYGYRAGERADFATIGVTLSIPLFTGDRQDRRLSAAKQDSGAARLDRAARLRDLERDHARALADWQRLEERIALYSEAVNAHARETREASLTAYAGGTADFPELVRSQLAELDTELTYLSLQRERAKAWAKLVYLAGDPS